MTTSHAWLANWRFCLFQTIQFQLNKGEYGIPESQTVSDVQFDPSDYGIIQNYDEVRPIY